MLNVATPVMDHWPLFYRGCVGTLKDWLVRTVSAALRKGDARLTLDRVREQELVEASLAEMAADIVSGEQQVALTSGDRSQLKETLHKRSITATIHVRVGCWQRTSLNIL